jgi:mRNA interferase HigB
MGLINLTFLPMMIISKSLMKVVGRELVIDFIKKHSDAKSALESWIQEASKADWATPQDIKERYRNASFLEGNRVVINIKGNRYRLVIKVAYQTKIVLIKWVGTHSEYDKLTL